MLEHFRRNLLCHSFTTPPHMAMNAAKLKQSRAEQRSKEQQERELLALIRQADKRGAK